MARLMVAACTAALICTVAAPASAGLLGSTVDVTARFPDTSSIFDDPGSAIVSAAIEYPAGSYPSYNSSWQVDVQDNRIIVTDATASGLSFQTASFNGFVLHIISGPSILSAFIDGASTIVPVSALVSGGDLFINFSGVDHDVGGSAIVNFTTGNGAPEPVTWALMLTGFGGLGAVLRRRRQQAAVAV